MSFYFSDLVIGDDGNDNFDYTQFLAEPIYDWLNSPEEILQVCDEIEEEKKKRKLQLFNNHNHKILHIIKK